MTGLGEADADRRSSWTRKGAGSIFTTGAYRRGPIFRAPQDVWDADRPDLAKNDVSCGRRPPPAAPRSTLRGAPHNLGARPPFRGDFSYDLGDFLPAVIGRHAELLKLATKSAQDWKDEAAKARVETLKSARADAMAKYGGENWVVNKAVHYTEWANFSKVGIQVGSRSVQGAAAAVSMHEARLRVLALRHPVERGVRGAALPLRIDQPQSQGKVA